MRAAAEGLGMQSVMQDLGWKMRVRLWVDSSAAKSIASRIGLGRVRHREVKFLWLQTIVRDKRLEVRKVYGTQKPADILTKPKSAGEVAEQFAEKHLQMIARKKDAPTDSVGVVGVVGVDRGLCDCCRRRSKLFSRGAYVPTMC